MKQTSRLFKSLSDDTRLRILALLIDGELCVCDLMAVLELPQSTVSRHLATLRNTGLVKDRRQGVWVYYRLTDVSDSLAASLLPHLLTHLAGQEGACRDRAVLQKYLEKKAADACG